jgi:hypothetical protein
MSQGKLERSRDSLGFWVWLLPAAYAIHVIEEAFGGSGLTGWMSAGGGVRLSLAQFAGLNIIAFVLLCLAAWAAGRWEGLRWPLVTGATIILANGAAHALISVATRSYVPGLWSGLVLYIPVGAIFLIRLWRLVSRRWYAAAAAAGFIIHGAVIWIVLRLPGFRPG